MEIVKLGDYVNIKTGKLDANCATADGKYPFFTCAITPLKINTFSYDCECVLVAGNGDLNVKYYNGKFDAYQRTYIIESKDKELLSVPYLFRFLEKYVIKLRETAIGGVIKYIKLGNLTEAVLPLPNINLQNQIVNNLEELDKIIGLKNKQVCNLDLLVNSKFNEMFGDPIENLVKWQVKSLIDMGELKNGMNFRNSDRGVKINCLGVGDFKNYSKIENTEKLPLISLNQIPSDNYLLKDEDIVFVRSNGNKNLVGRSVIVYPKNILTTYSGFCIRYRKNYKGINTQYLIRVLKTDSIREKLSGRGVNIQNLNQKIISQIKVPIPPIDLQNCFADFVEQVEVIKKEIERSIEQLEILKKLLMQKYFG